MAYNASWSAHEESQSPSSLLQWMYSEGKALSWKKTSGVSVIPLPCVSLLSRSKYTPTRVILKCLNRPFLLCSFSNCAALNEREPLGWPVFPPLEDLSSFAQKNPKFHWSTLIFSLFDFLQKTFFCFFVCCWWQMMLVFVWWCRVQKGTGSQVYEIFPEEARAGSGFIGVYKAVWRLLLVLHNRGMQCSWNCKRWWHSCRMWITKDFI